VSELRDAIERARGDAELDARMRLLVAREPFEIDPAHELVRAVREAAGDTELVGMPFWADSALIAAAGIPTVLYGPAGEGAHAAVEWVDLESAARCRTVYAAVARALCG
jgi:acetylornithine deacetylase